MLASTREHTLCWTRFWSNCLCAIVDLRRVQQSGCSPKLSIPATQIKRALARTHSAEHTPVFQSDCDDNHFGTNGKSHLVLITTWDHQWVFGDDDLSRLKTRTLQGIHIYKAKKNNIVFSIIFIKEKQCFNNIWKSNNTVNMYNNLWVTMLVAIVIIINIPLKGFGRRV